MSSWVSKKIEVKSHKLLGHGAFSISPITKGEILIVQGGDIEANKETFTAKFENITSYCFQINKEYAICPIDENHLDGIFSVNHSCEPNCGMKDNLTMVAMRDIAVGEEVTLDYAMIDADYDDIVNEVIQCRCGSISCRKVQDGNSWRLPELQRRYKGYFSPYIQEMIANS